MKTRKAGAPSQFRPPALTPVHFDPPLVADKGDVFETVIPGGPTTVAHADGSQTVHQHGSNPTTSTESLGRLTTITTADSAVDGVGEVAVPFVERPAQFVTESITVTPNDLSPMPTQFEQLIDIYTQKGYRLHSWNLAAVVVPGLGVCEIIVAVFESKE